MSITVCMGAYVAEKDSALRSPAAQPPMARWGEVQRQEKGTRGDERKLEPSAVDFIRRGPEAEAIASVRVGDFF